MTTITNTLKLKAKLLRGLADSSRLSVLECMVLQPRCVSEIVDMTRLSQPNVSNHLACLKECGLVEREQQGRFVYYRMADARVARLLEDIERIIEPIARNVEECANYLEGEEEAQ